MELTSAKKYFLIVLPVFLTSSTSLVFSKAAQWLGNDQGYLLGFGFYWIWCLSVPFIFWGRRGFRRVFTEGTPLFKKKNCLLVGLLSLTVVGAIWMYFIPHLSTVSIWIVLFSPVTIINGSCEEILWRGVYVKAFGKNVFLACIYPAIGFALSHISSALVFPAEGGMLPFIISTFFLGLVYGWVAYRTGSAKWTAITHSLIGLLAFGEPISSSIVRLVLP
ncbi:MAG: CPBP family intramembrane metalloprotease [Chloroflexi bacterium]|nr:CPBP family intramembrane metalloprotease [Chloroflexota bacterium]